MGSALGAEPVPAPWLSREVSGPPFPEFLLVFLMISSTDIAVSSPTQLFVGRSFPQYLPRLRPSLGCLERRVLFGQFFKQLFRQLHPEESPEKSPLFDLQTVPQRSLMSSALGAEHSL